MFRSCLMLYVDVIVVVINFALYRLSFIVYPFVVVFVVSS